MTNNNNGSGMLLLWIVCFVMGCSCISSVAGSAAVPFFSRDTPAGQGAPWTSKAYGDLKNAETKSCADGAYVAGVAGFDGQADHTNAVQLYCLDPTTKKTTPLLDGVTCGKRDRPDAGESLKAFGKILMNVTLAVAGVVLSIVTFGAATPAVIAGFVGLGAVQLGAGLATDGIVQEQIEQQLGGAGYGRKAWNQKTFTSGAGIDRVQIRQCNNGEVCGLRFHGGGKSSQWIGGSQGTVWGRQGPRQIAPTGKIVDVKCPAGKVVTGVAARCGDRVDAVQFVCR